MIPPRPWTTSLHGDFKLAPLCYRSWNCFPRGHLFCTLWHQIAHFVWCSVWTCFWKLPSGGVLWKKCDYDTAQCPSQWWESHQNKALWIFVKDCLLQANANLLFPRTCFWRLVKWKDESNIKEAFWLRELYKIIWGGISIVLNVAWEISQVLHSYLYFLFLFASPFIIFKHDLLQKVKLSKNNILINDSNSWNNYIKP